MAGLTPLLCLALNVYGEARGESPLGQVAVAHVTLNRVADPAYPDDICAVVYQRNQFSWTKHPVQIREPDALAQAFIVSAKVLLGMADDPTHGATHFFSGSVAPSLAAHLSRTTRIGGHTFFEGT